MHTQLIKSGSALVVLVVMFAALIGASFLYLKTRPSADNTQENATSTPAVSIAPVSYDVIHTDNGFSLPLFPIKAGDTVRFVNQGTTTMRVASDPHPTHTDLPGFDQKFAGDVYEYTFTKPGLWKYHNHFDPTEKGTVFVQ